MKKRTFWLAASAVALLVGLVLAINYATAQPPRPPMGGGFGGMFGPQSGRFICAYGSASEVIVLDTATGKLYRAERKDFHKMSELPKVQEGPRPIELKDLDPFGGRDRFKDKKPRKGDDFKEKKEGDEKDKKDDFPEKKKKEEDGQN